MFVDAFHANPNPFTLIALTDAINNLAFQPGRIGQMGIFNETSVSVIDIAIEEREGVLALIPPTARGAPGVTLPKTGRAMRVFRTPHFEINDGVMAEEVQGVRAFGTESEVEALQTRVGERLYTHRASHEATLEYSRIGAIKGIVIYADGTQLNLFDEFDVTPEAPVPFDLANPNPVGGVLRETCAKLGRTMSRNLGGTLFTGIVAVCGDNFFDALLKHPEVRATFLQTPDAGQLRMPYINFDGMIYGTFPFGGIVWENYRGYVGGTEFIDTDKAYFFPTGIMNLFRTYMAPADYNETVNTLGQRLYAKQRDMSNDKGVHLDTQMNNLNICTRPKCLMQGTK